MGSGGAAAGVLMLARLASNVARLRPCSVKMPVAAAHRHGWFVHSHVHAGRHRHALRPALSRPVAADPHLHVHDEGHGHSHGLVDDSIKRSREGLVIVPEPPEDES
jgi:hypothetical protein